MPTYRRKCSVCPHIFDHLAPISTRDEAQACPRCASPTERVQGFQGVIGVRLSRALDALRREGREGASRSEVKAVPEWVTSGTSVGMGEERMSVMGNVSGITIENSVMPGIDASGTRNMKIKNSLILTDVALRTHDVDGLDLEDVSHISGFDTSDSTAS